MDNYISRTLMQILIPNTLFPLVTILQKRIRITEKKTTLFSQDFNFLKSENFIF